MKNGCSSRGLSEAMEWDCSGQIHQSSLYNKRCIQLFQSRKTPRMQTMICILVYCWSFLLNNANPLPSCLFLAFLLLLAERWAALARVSTTQTNDNEVCCPPKQRCGMGGSSMQMCFGYRTTISSSARNVKPVWASERKVKRKINHNYKIKVKGPRPQKCPYWLFISVVKFSNKGEVTMKYLFPTSRRALDFSEEW